MSQLVRAYGLDRDLRTKDFGPVSLEDAIRIVHERFARFRLHYESGEEALSETMFGFSRATNEFIELCIHGHDHISFRSELPSLRPAGWLKRLTSVVAFEDVLTGRDEVVRRVTAFLTLPEAEFARQLETNAPAS